MSFGSLVFTPVVKMLPGASRKPQSIRTDGMQGVVAGASGAGGIGLFSRARQFLLGYDGSNRVALHPASRWPERVSESHRRPHSCVGGFSRQQQYLGTGEPAHRQSRGHDHGRLPWPGPPQDSWRVDVLEGELAQPWIERVHTPGYQAVIERVFVIHVEAFDWNCPQHITPRYTTDEIRMSCARGAADACARARERRVARQSYVTLMS